MPCLIGCLVVLFPRVVILLLFFFSNYLTGIWDNKLWPILGFFFLPLTTLAYAYAKHNAPGGQIDGFYLGLVIVAIVLDLTLHGGGGWRARRRRVVD